MSSSVNADNDSVVDEINITVPISCTMTGNGMTSHNASIPNGTYTDDIGTTALKAFCNDNSGFAIYAAGYTGNEIGATNSTKLVGTSASNNATIDTGTATGPVSGNDTSNWAMKLTALSNPTPTYPITITSDTSGSFSSYHAVPSEYTKVATRTSGTDIGQSAEGSTLTTTYAAYISKTQAADTYTGQVIYTLVHPNDAAAPIPPVVCNPTGTTIGTNTSTDIKCMQDISSTNKSSILTSMTLEQQYTLKDSRDSKEYMIAKLADGNIWMTQNLDLDLDSSRTYTNLDTDIGYNSTTGQYETASWTPERSTYSPDVTHWNDYNATTNPTGVDGNYHPESYDPGNLYWSGIRNDDTPVSTGSPHYHLGNYYNTAAAMAANNISEYFSEETWNDVNRSICPAGWMLPKGLGEDYDNPVNGSIYYLLSFYGWDGDNINGMTVQNPNVWDRPIKLTLSGYYPFSFYALGHSGTLHVSEIVDSYEEYHIYITAEGGEDYNGSRIVPADRGPLFLGASIRCLVR